MRISNKMAISAFIVLMLMLILSLRDINIFMKSEAKCEPGFAIIERCKCIPDENLAKLFNVPYPQQFPGNYHK